MKKKIGLSILKALLLLFVIVLAVVSAYPIIWMVLNCFRSNREIYSDILGFPKSFNFQVFADAWNAADFGRAFMNSIFIVFFEVLIIVAASSLAAYAITILNVKGSRKIYSTAVSLQTVSGHFILVSLFLLIKNLGLMNNLWSCILVGSALGLPLSIMIFRGSFMAFPMELYESAVVEGCGSLRFFFTILMPLSKSAFASVAIYQTIFAWNEYLFALTFLHTPKTRTITTAIQVFFTQWQSNWTQVFAILSIALVPVLVLYIAFQKNFIAGITAGAVKG